MTNSQLYQYFKDNGISLSDIAAATGYNYTYVAELLNGTTPLTAAAKFRIIDAYPDTAVFLLPSLAQEPA